MQKFRNTNGIYTKIQNFKFTDPNEKGNIQEVLMVHKNLGLLSKK